MNNNLFFGMAALLVGAGYFLRSLPLAFALPQGPNVSTGSNPVQQYFLTCPGSIMTTTSEEFVITDIVLNPKYYGNDAIIFSTTSATLGKIKQTNEIIHIPLQSGIRIPTNETVSCTVLNGGNIYNSNEVLISGYFAHP